MTAVSGKRPRPLDLAAQPRRSATGSSRSSRRGRARSAARRAVARGEPAILLDRPPLWGRQRSPASWRSASHAAARARRPRPRPRRRGRAARRARGPPASRTAVWAGFSHHHSPGSPSRLSAAAYASQLAIAGGTPWRGSRLPMCGRTDAIPVSRAGVHRRVRRQRGDERQLAAQRVVDRERASAPRTATCTCSAETSWARARRRSARRSGRTAHRGLARRAARRTGARPRPRTAGRRRPRPAGPAAPRRARHRVAGGRGGGRTISSCAAGSSSVNRPSAADAGLPAAQRLARPGREVERRRVEEHQLLLDPDGQGRRGVEAGPQGVGSTLIV